jgi:molybdate transport system substrate-binding protein
LAGGELTVFAAASLTGRVRGDRERPGSGEPGSVVTYNFGGSQALVTQLKEGAEADVFASANAAQVDVAKEAGLIADEATTFVRNRLAIVTPVQHPAGIEVRPISGPRGFVWCWPNLKFRAGRYARESVCTMGIDVGTYGARFTERVAANVVSEEEDVRDVLAR